MPITNADLKLLKAERMTDTADGGGRMTQVAVVDNATNDVFGPLPTLSNAAGLSNLRKVFLALQADNNEAVYSANLFLSSPPADPNVNVLMIAKRDWQDDRASALGYLPALYNNDNEQFYGVTPLAIAALINATSITVTRTFQDLSPDLQMLYAVTLKALPPVGTPASALATYTFTVPVENILLNTLDLVFSDDFGEVHSIQNAPSGTSVFGNYSVSVNYATGVVTVLGLINKALPPILRPMAGGFSGAAGASSFSANLGFVNIVGSSILLTITTNNGQFTFNALVASGGGSVFSQNIQTTTNALSVVTVSVNVATGDMTVTSSPTWATFTPSSIQLAFTHANTAAKINPYTLSYACTARATKGVFFEPGNLLTVHNSLTVASATYTNGGTVNLGRTNIAAVTVRTAAGAIVEAPGRYTVNFAAGVLTWVSVAGIMPVTIEHRVDDTAVCTAINGNVLTLNKPLSRAYALAGTFVSTVIDCDDLQARASEPFDQQTWTGVWSDNVIGNRLLAHFDHTRSPLVLNNIGCMQERWLLLFDTATTFRVIGETVGIVGSGNITSNCSPINPANARPYFTLAFNGWGAGWVAGNCLRFNTFAASYPVWLIRSVGIGALAQTTDTFRLVARGNAL